MEYNASVRFVYFIRMQDPKSRDKFAFPSAVQLAENAFLTEYNNKL
jgi:hypothetical protein